MSVSVFALEADFASRNRASSICKVFFIHIILPYLYGRMSPTLVRIGTRGQLTCEGMAKSSPDPQTLERLMEAHWTPSLYIPRRQFLEQV